IEVTDVDEVPPAIPSGLAAVAGDTQVVLNWTANTESDLKEYKLYWGLTTNPTTVIKINKGIETYTHTGLTNGTVYYYKIAAVDQVGNESALSASVNAKLMGVQSITFAALPNARFNDAPIPLTAT